MFKYPLFLAPEKAFALIAVFFGCLFILVTPPFQVSDEYQHFFRSYQVSELNFIAQREVRECHGRTTYKGYTTCVGGRLPLSIFLTAKNSSSQELRFQPQKKQKIEDLITVLKYRFNPKNRLFVRFPNAALYSPIPYLPQALGIATGRLLHCPSLILFYLGRFSNLLTWLTLTYWAIKIIPFHKNLLFLLALTPMSLFQAASLSADALTNGLSYLLISTTLAYSFNLDIKFLKTSHLLGFSLLLILLSLCKSTYFILLFLYLLIPTYKLETVKKYWLNFAVILTITLTLITSWSIYVQKFIYTPLNINLTTVSAAKQLDYILNHPLVFIHTLLNSLLNYGIYGIEQFIGKLGWLDTSLPPFLIIIYSLILLLVALTNSQQKFSIFQRLLILVIVLINSLLIVVAMYLTWTPVGAKLIEGIQGRYFIPIAPLFFILLSPNKPLLSLDYSVKHLSFFAIFSSVITTIVLFNRYW